MEWGECENFLDLEFVIVAFLQIKKKIAKYLLEYNIVSLICWDKQRLGIILLRNHHGIFEALALAHRYFRDLVLSPLFCNYHPYP